MPTCFARTVPILCCLAALVPGRAVAGDSPRAVIERLTGEVLAVLGNASLPSDEKRRQIENLVYADTDFETLSRLVLARNWSRFTAEQQTEFMQAFKRHLALTYGKNIENYKNERVAVESEREEAHGDWMVKTEFVRGGADNIEIDYRLRRRDDRWTIIDFIVENVSLVANYRAQFQDILGGGSPERLLQLLREKNASGTPLKAPGA